MRFPARLAVALVAGLAVGCGSSKGSLQDHLAAAERLTSENKLREALIEYQSAVRAAPEDAGAREKLAEAFVKIGDVPHAVNQMVRAADLRPDDTKLQVQAAKLLLASGQFEDARGRAEKALKADPKNVVAHIVRASAAARMRDADAAISELQDTIQLNPNRASTYIDLARLQAGEGLNAEAEAGFKQAVVVDPKSIQARMALATFYWRGGRLKEAEQSIQNALAIDPNNIPANTSLVSVYRATRRFADIEAPLKRLVEASARRPESLLALADYYISQKRESEARTILVDLSKQKESAAAARARLAGVEYAGGRPAEAHRLMDALITEQPKNAQLLVLKGTWLLGEKRVDDALAMAQKAAMLDPKSVDALFLEGTAHATKGNVDEAVTAFTAALQLRPGSADLLVALANANTSAGDEVAAIGAAEQAVKAAPSSDTARFALARALFADGKLDEATRELAPVIKAAPDSAEVLTLQGQVLQRRGDVAGARRSLLRALEIDSRNTTALVAITNLDLATRRGEATARVDAAAARHPRDAGILMVAARTHAANGDLVRAESELKQIIEIDPSKLEAYHALGQLYVRQKNLDGAVTWYQQRLQKKPQDIGAHTMVGMIRIVQGKHTEARADFERALAIDPRAAVASNNLAYLDAEAGTNLDIALNRAQTAMAALPDDADVSDTLGWVYVKRGLPALAISRFQHAIQKSPSNPLYHYHLGLAYAKAGDNEHARSSLRQALKLSPSFEGAAVAKQMLNGLGG